LTVLRLVIAARLPLVPDEAYYWLWTQHLQPGYYDHPPMVALWIRAGTMLAGDNPLGVRLLGPLSSAFGSILLARAGEDLLPHRQAGLIAAALLNATLIAGAGSILMTPDTPLLFFWTAGIAALARLIATRDQRWWLAIGAAAGAALLSKYTGLLFLAATGFWLVTRPDGRAMLRTPWPWAGLALALLIFAPNIWWNAGHGWISYLKQGGRVTQFEASRALQFLAELLGGQIGLATPIIFALAASGLWHLRRANSTAAHLLIWLTAVPGVVFLEHTISGRVQANWPAILYPSACIAAAALPMTVLRRWLTPAIGLGLALTALIYTQALANILPLPARHDPAALQLDGWADFAAAATANNPAFITSDDYSIAAELALLAPPATIVAGFDPRWRYFGMPSAEALTGASGILVTKRADTPCPYLLGTVTRKRGTQTIITYRLCRITAPGNGVILPRP
jgi:4-amino-4-deoxy-L-arabinose transferase-like glycosyltransferase